MSLIVTTFTTQDYYADQDRQKLLFLYCNQELKCAVKALNVNGKPALFVDVECPLLVDRISKLKDVKIFKNNAK